MKIAQRITPLAMLALSATCLAVPVMADDEDRACSIATLKGTFGLHGYGMRPVGQTLQDETHETIALRSYDGKGGVKSWPIVSQGTYIGALEGDGSFSTGTYEVNPDCTGKVTILLVTAIGKIPIVARFVIVDQGREIFEVPTGNRNVGVAILKRQ